MSGIRLVSKLDKWIGDNQIEKIREYILSVYVDGFAKNDCDRTYNGKYACIEAVNRNRIEILRLLLKHAEVLSLDLTYNNYAAMRYACYLSLCDNDLNFEFVNVFLVHCSPNLTKGMLKYVCDGMDPSYPTKKVNLIKFILNHQNFDPTLSAHETLFSALVHWNKALICTLLKDPRIKQFTSDCILDKYNTYHTWPMGKKYHHNFKTFDDWIYKRFERNFQVYATVLCLRKMDSISDDVIKSIVNFI